MFMDELRNQVNSQKVFTENGAVGYKKFGNTFVDFNFRISSYRNMDESAIMADFFEMMNEDQILAMKMLFMARDVRGGLGERRLFKVIMKNLADTNPDLVKKVIPIIPEYGKWDDLFELFGTKCEKQMVSFVKDQINKDLISASKNESISILAKWMPSINTSNRNTVNMAYKFANEMKLTPRQYRKMLTNLRSILNLPETNLSANRIDKVVYPEVASKAHLNLKNVFLRKDADRYIAFLESTKRGETKINAATLAPYEVWNKYAGEQSYYSRRSVKYDETLEQLWKNLKSYGNLENTLVVADGSGSMSVKLGKTNITALDVAQSLAVYFGERCEGQYKNNFITFSERPQLVNFGDGTLKSKIDIVSKYTEVANTNIEAVFDLILTTAKSKNMSQEDLPKTIVVISDMEFDSATCSNRGSRLNKTLFEGIQDKYAENGYQLPRLAFWNVNSRNLAVPIQINKMGVNLVSGFNQAAIKMVMSGNLDPFLAIKDMLDNKRYDLVYEKIAL